MKCMVYTLLIWRAISWKPSYIMGSMNCDDRVTGTIEMFEQHFYSLWIDRDLNITLSNCESAFDTQMTIFDSHHNEISSNYCDGDDCPEHTSKCAQKDTKHEVFTMPLSSGVYYISINGFSSDYGVYVIQTTCTSQQSHTRNDESMFTIHGSFICSELLIHNIDIIYGSDYDACVYEYCLPRDECVMINYVNNFKSSTDSRCYLFDTECDIIEVDTERYDTQIALKKHTQCMDLYSDWTDALGDTCDYYETFGWCADGTIRSNLTLDDFVDIKDTTYGLTARDVCCGCGGGVYVVYDVGMKVAYSTDAASVDILDANTPMKQTTRAKWNKLKLYQICITMLKPQLKDAIDCDIVMDTKLATNNYNYNISFVECEYEYDAFIMNNESLYFILVVGMEDADDKSTVYINTEWFDLNHDGDIAFSYEECVDDLVFSNYNKLYAILPYDIPSTNTNISFANTTIAPAVYTTTDIQSKRTTTALDIQDRHEDDDKAIEFLRSNRLVVIVIAGFVFVIVVILLFMIWFCRHSHKKEKQSKIEFSKLKTDVMNEMDRRCSMISLEGFTDPPDEEEEEEKIGILNHEEDTYTASDNNRCLLCYDRRANTVLLPCGHVCFCNDCIQCSIDNDRRCPQCRQKVTDWKQIFRGGFRL